MRCDPALPAHSRRVSIGTIAVTDVERGDLFTGTGMVTVCIMIHYNLWFSLCEGADEAKDLAIIQAFLGDHFAAGSIAGFRLLKNSADVAQTKLHPYQAIIEFHDDAQFSTTFAAQAARGIHFGKHGDVMAQVSEFHVELFRQIAASTPSATAL